MSSEQQLGLAGELWALEELQARGYPAQLCSDWLADVDMILDGVLPVEVKLSRPRPQPHGKGWRERWQWDVSRLPKNADSLVLLIAEDGEGARFCFVVPSWVFFGRGTRTPSLTSHPLEYAHRGRGYLARYFEAWHLIPEVLATRRRLAGQLTLPLFAMETSQ